MKVNLTLDVNKSDGGIASGNTGLSTVSETSAADQSVFTFGGDIEDANLLLLFVDGRKFEKVDEVGDLVNNTYFFDGTEVTINPEQPSGVVVSALYVASGEVTLQAEPVTLQEVKNWLRIDLDDDDDILTMLITAARETLEAYTNVSFISRVVKATIKNQLGGYPLPYGPVGDIISFTDKDGEDITDYEITGTDFKQVETAFFDPVTVEYNAGYSVPPTDFKTAILCQVALMYENRGEATISGSAKALLSKYRRVI